MKEIQANQVDLSLSQDRIKTDRKEKDLRKACREFESIFTYQLLKSMRQSVQKCDLFHGGQGEEVYESLFDMELSKQVAGLGPNSLAGALYQQLKGSADPVEDRPQWPLKEAISSGFGWRKDPVDGEVRFHHGVDFDASPGTPVQAALPGKVLFSGSRSELGNIVILDHGSDLTTLYGHNKENFVSREQWVKKGTPIAEVGSTGRSSRPHLHFEVRNKRQSVNPLEMLRNSE